MNNVKKTQCTENNSVSLANELDGFLTNINYKYSFLLQNFQLFQ